MSVTTTTATTIPGSSLLQDLPVEVVARVIGCIDDAGQVQAARESCRSLRLAATEALRGRPLATLGLVQTPGGWRTGLRSRCLGRCGPWRERFPSGLAPRRLRLRLEDGPVDLGEALAANSGAFLASVETLEVDGDAFWSEAPSSPESPKASKALMPALVELRVAYRAPWDGGGAKMLRLSHALAGAPPTLLRLEVSCARRPVGSLDGLAELFPRLRELVIRTPEFVYGLAGLTRMAELERVELGPATGCIPWYNIGAASCRWSGGDALRVVATIEPHPMPFVGGAHVFRLSALAGAASAVVTNALVLGAPEAAAPEAWPRVSLELRGCTVEAAALLDAPVGLKLTLAGELNLMLAPGADAAALLDRLSAPGVDLAGIEVFYVNCMLVGTSSSDLLDLLILLSMFVF